MSTYQILSLLGVGGIFAAIWTWTIAKIKELRKQNEALKLGVQALLRAKMISEFNEWSKKGYVPIWARQNFENMWIHYEALGQNGVMLDIHDRFMALPTTNN